MDNTFYINEIKRLQQEVETLREVQARNKNFWLTLVERIPAQVYLQQKDYTIAYANEKFISLYGNYHGKKCYEVIHGRSTPCESCNTFEVFKTGKAQIWEDIHDNGAAVNLIYDYPFTDENGTELVLEMGIDITASYGDEQRRKNLFANVSHELRTPITKIMGYAEAMLDATGNEKNIYADCIQNNAHLLSKLIEDLFELAKVEISETFALETVNVTPILQEFLEEQQLYYADKEICYTYKLPQQDFWVRVDINRLMQVLSNIIGNAYDHRGQGKVVFITVQAVEERLDIAIFNEGNTIPVQDMQYLFRRYYQADMVGNKGEHLGIGLSICKNIIDKMNGEIWAENSGNTGVVFHIQLPLLESEALAEC